MIENLPLNDEDMKNLKLFDIILQSNMSMSTYNLLKKHFMTELLMSSIFMLQARISKLSHVTEVSYDCCVNTCCCFTRTYTGLDSCPFHNRKVKKTPLSVVHRGSNMDLRGYSPNLLVSTGDCLETTFRMVFQVMGVAGDHCDTHCGVQLTT